MALKNYELPELLKGYESGEHYTLSAGRLANASFFGEFRKFLELAKEELGAFSRLLECYPCGTTYVYRSSDTNGTNSYSRLNTTFYVFCPEKFEDEKKAEEFLDSTGLVPILERVKGAAVLISPVSDSWTQADVDAFVSLQRSGLECMMDLFGSFGMNYLIGVGKGSDFIHNFVLGTPEIAGRTAGALLIGGAYDPARAKLNSSAYGVENDSFPVWLVGADDLTRKAYLALHRMENRTSVVKDGNIIYTSDEHPYLQMVFQENGKELRDQIESVYESFLRKLMRIPVAPGRNSFMDSTYFALGRRWTPEELDLTYVVHESGEVLEGTSIRRWYEYIPTEFMGTSEKKVPMILVLHGHCDDPRALMEQCGFMKLAGDERIVCIAPDHQNIEDINADNLFDEENKFTGFAKLVDYMLEKYPFIDPSRVYCTGFSRGALNTCIMSFFETEKFAAAAPLSGLGMSSISNGVETASYDLWKQYKEKKGQSLCPGLPIYTLVCGRDNVFSDRMGLSAVLRRDRLYLEGRGGAVDALNAFRVMNGLPELDYGSYDFEKYGFWGFPMDKLPYSYTPDSVFRSGQIVSDAGVPLMRFETIDGFEHALYYHYAERMWGFCRHYSRDTETKEVRYQ